MRKARRRAPFLAFGAIIAALALPAAASADTFTFTNETQIDLGPNAGAGNPYPSSIAVSGLTGITDVNVRLNNMNHGQPQDIDAAVVGPTGVAVFLISDSCGGAANLFRTLTIDDSAAVFATAGSACPTGSYLPSNFDGAPEDYFAPGPTGAQQVNNLAAFNGVDPNGTWNLFAQDDTNLNSGAFVGGWTLTLEGVQAPPPAGTPPGNPTSSVNPAGNIRKRKCKKKKKTTKSAEVAKKKKCKKKKHR